MKVEDEMVSPGRIDTHQHIVPPAYATWLDRKGIAAGGLPIPHWNADAAVALMDRHGIETGILSVSTPGVHLGDDAEARAMARRVNDYTAEVVAKHPGRFGLFATLTLPDVEGAIAEAAYAFDVLRADGVVLLASVGGVYLGDSAFDALFDELNRRRAVVFIHPSALAGLGPLPGAPPYVADFLLDTTRAAIRLCGSGTLDRCPDLRVILSHAGGFVPYAASRIATAASPTGDARDGLAKLQSLYFDLALSSSPFALPSLLSFAQPGHVLYATDWPYASDRTVAGFARMYERYDLDTAQRASIDRGAAEALFPRLRQEAAPAVSMRADGG
jgi:predicted TIM-barrel fold metal-dependent hydrolase